MEEATSLLLKEGLLGATINPKRQPTMTKKTLEEYQIQEIARTVFIENAKDFVRHQKQDILRVATGMPREND